MKMKKKSERDNTGTKGHRATNEHLSMITLNVNELKAPIKRYKVAEWIKNVTSTYAAYKRLTSA